MVKRPGAQKQPSCSTVKLSKHLKDFNLVSSSGRILCLSFICRGCECVAANALTDREPKLSQRETKSAENKQTDSSFFRKMRHEVTLKSEILSQLDFKSAAQDVVFNCVDGQV